MPDLDGESTVNEIPAEEMGTAEMELIDETVERFELSYLRGERPDLDDYLEGSGPLRLALLQELIHTDLEHRLRSDPEFKIEYYLQKYPECFETPCAVLELVSVEWDVRKSRQDAAAAADLLQRFPEFSQAIRQFVERGIVTHDIATEAVNPLRPRLHFGRFQLLAEIGTGAFSTVWKVFDPDLERTVALKVLRLGQFSSDQDVRRFIRESRCAANLKHPAIVPVLEAGRIKNECYLISEYLEGGTLADLMGERTLTPREAAAMAAELADALHAAHAAGVIHRDIKPSNILLDSDGRPHLADFGLATSPCNEPTLTREGQLLGTPAYMSPEQAAGQPREVGPWTDTYSLGVVLYEMLAGCRPFTGEAQSVLQQVRESSPPRPGLHRKVPLDLENICLKALEKEPVLRYLTAGSLADDLRRFLVGRPVSARSIGLVSRVRKWCRREPLLASLAVSIAVILVVALLAITWQWRLAERHRRMAVKNLNQAREAVDYFTTVIDQHLAETPNSQPLRQQLLQRALSYYEDFIQQAPEDPSTRRQLANACFHAGELSDELGAVERSFEHHARALAIRQELVTGQPADVGLQADLARSFYRVGALQRNFGHLSEGAEDHAAALQIRKSMVSRFPEDLTLLRELGASYLSSGQLHAELGNPQDARRAYETARECLLAAPRSDGESDEQTQGVQRDLAVVCNRLGLLVAEQGELAKALDLHREALAILERLGANDPTDLARQRALAETYHCLGLAERETDMEAALQHFQQALAIRQDLVRLNPFVSRYLADLGYSYIYVTQACRDLKRPQEALDAALPGCEIHERLLKESPSFVMHRVRLAQSLAGAGRAYAELGQLEPARSYLLAEKQHVELLVAAEPDSKRFQKELANNAFALARISLKAENPAEALRWCELGDQQFRRAVERNPDSYELRRTWAKFLDLRTVKALRALGRDEEADEVHQRAQTLREATAGE